MSTALLTFSIGPVHTFIAQARRVADLWAGSALLSHLTLQAVKEIEDAPGCEMVYPLRASAGGAPAGFPNRFVCRVPHACAPALAQQLEDAVRTGWRVMLKSAQTELARNDLTPAGELSADDEARVQAALEVSWSWVEEVASDYATAARHGAEQFAGARLFRPFAVIREEGEKCTLCGERTALPDGQRARVRERWEAVAKRKEDEKADDLGFYRFDQSRLCRVCATKRLFPLLSAQKARFLSFQDFEGRSPKRRRAPASETGPEAEGPPYFALVALDGDKMSDKLGWGKDRAPGGEVRKFHSEISRRISDFAEQLRSTQHDHPQLVNYQNLGTHVSEPWPRLIYAGGEDVLFVATARDALRLALAVRALYRSLFSDLESQLPASIPGNERLFTISAGVLFAHSKYPAGLLYRDVEELLNEVAKRKEGRDAVAIRLLKRSGPATEVAFHWDEAPPSLPGHDWASLFDSVLDRLCSRQLASRQTYRLRDDEETLAGAFEGDLTLWQPWLAEQLSRGQGSREEAGELAALLAPFFAHGKTDCVAHRPLPSARAQPRPRGGAVSSAWRGFALAPHDVLFFRDGRPSSRGDDHYLGSVFPPNPATLYGALRTRRLADSGVSLRSLDGRCWRKLRATLRTELGEWGGLGELELRGPWLLRAEGGRQRLLLPAPADLALVLEQGSRRVAEVLRYRLEACDGRSGWSHPLGLWRVAKPETESAEGWFLDQEGWLQWAAGKVPAPGSLVHAEELWATEERTGVGLEKARRTAAESLLYTFGFVRLPAGVSLGLEVRNTSLQAGGFLRLGGEHRTAELAAGPSLAMAPTFAAGTRLLLATLSPLISPSGAYPPGFSASTLEAELGGVRCRLLGGLVRGAQRVGGWDLARNQAKPLVRAIPPGSVFAFEVLGGSAAGLAAKLWGACLPVGSDLARQGFGMVFSGLSP